jgi:tetratricopeptide (TPR) repeat protein
MPTPPRIIHLDEFEALPGPDTLTWLPVRATLGIRAFGCNAYRAGEVGHDVVEPHTEDPQLAHEELYFVAVGRATFTIDGQSYDAPAGSYIFIPDPASDRHAVAAEPGTTVLSFGGPPVFTPSAWEWTFRAAALRQRGDREAARAVLEDGLANQPERASVYYEMACLEATGGRLDEASSALARALELRPELRESAQKDPDFDALRSDPRFGEIVGG